MVRAGDTNPLNLNPRLVWGFRRGFGWGSGSGGVWVGGSGFMYLRVNPTQTPPYAEAHEPPSEHSMKYKCSYAVFEMSLLI